MYGRTRHPALTFAILDAAMVDATSGTFRRLAGLGSLTPAQERAYFRIRRKARRAWHRANCTRLAAQEASCSSR